jgi:hypothetical protein
MAKKQTRRSVSLSSAAFARASELAKIRGISLSQLTERALAAEAKPGEIPTAPVLVDGTGQEGVVDRELPAEIFEPVIGVLIEPTSVPTEAPGLQSSFEVKICESPVILDVAAADAVVDLVVGSYEGSLEIEAPGHLKLGRLHHVADLVGGRYEGNYETVADAARDAVEDDGIHVEYDEA